MMTTSSSKKKKIVFMSSLVMSSSTENTENTNEHAINRYMSMWEGKLRKQKHKTTALNVARP